jgi:hypothetical protein
METLPDSGLDSAARIALGQSLWIILRVGVRGISGIDRPQGIVDNLLGDLTVVQFRNWLHCMGHVGLLQS